MKGIKGDFHVRRSFNATPSNLFFGLVLSFTRDTFLYRRPNTLLRSDTAVRFCPTLAGFLDCIHSFPSIARLTPPQVGQSL
jgi:hypothetical protein